MSGKRTSSKTPVSGEPGLQRQFRELRGRLLATSDVDQNFQINEHSNPNLSLNEK